MRWIMAVLALAGLVVGGCGGTEDAGRPPTVALSLDFVPNAVHAPIYMAVHGGRDRKQGIRLQMREPGGGPDALKLVAGGRVDLGVLDTTISRSRGRGAPTSWPSARSWVARSPR
jgi:putative hydroxymethylpyrimidine transport system substrate-binding protein